jgi:hypothetical protein
MPHNPTYPDGLRPHLFEDGLEFQDFVCVQLARHGIIVQNFTSKRWQCEVGENLQGYEIKLDIRCHETGRLSIEIAEKAQASNARWVPSGIYRNDNTWLYIQGNRREIFIFPKNRLVGFHRKIKPQEHESYGTIRKFYLPMYTARQIAARIILCDKDLQHMSAGVQQIVPPIKDKGEARDKALVVSSAPARLPCAVG